MSFHPPPVEQMRILRLQLSDINSFRKKPKGINIVGKRLSGNEAPIDKQFVDATVMQFLPRQFQVADQGFPFNSPGKSPAHLPERRLVNAWRQFSLWRELRNHVYRLILYLRHSSNTTVSCARSDWRLMTRVCKEPLSRRIILDRETETWHYRRT